jgi:GNAT superfamily N-acetyltransferase
MIEEAAGGAAMAATVRRAGPKDAHAIAEVTVASWQEAYRDILPEAFLGSLQVGAREKAWRDMLSRDEQGRMPAWVAEGENGVGGFVSCGPARDDDVPAPSAEVYAIYVRPGQWRKGLGRSLLEAATAHCQAEGSRTLVLWVLEANDRARAFYEAMGWQPDGGRREFELGSDRATEIRYRRTAG